MLAGFLGVTPTWFMHGVGQAPLEIDNGERTSVLRSEIQTLKMHHEKLGERIDQLENIASTLKAA